MIHGRFLVRAPALLPALLFLCIAGPARADYAADHPEYFSITAPPPAGSVLAPTFGVPVGVVLHPGNGGIFPQLMTHLASVPAILIHGGSEDRKQIEAMLTGAGLSPDSYQWHDFEQLNTTATGEYFPMILGSDSGMRLVDPRYLQNRQYDDAAGSKLAAVLSTCAWRPPVFLTRGFIDTDGQGTCVVSSKLHSKSYPLSAAEINGILKSYLGCKNVVVLQSLNFDPEGRLDTFFRYAMPDKVFVGQYEVAQDSANVGTLKDNAKALEAALPEGTTVQTLPLPTPIQVGDTTVRPSYLAYLQLPKVLLAPVFPDDTEHEAEALAILKQTFPAFEHVTIDATNLTLSGSRLTGAVGTIPGEAWDTGCTPPEVLCESPKPADCPLCWSECSPGEKICLSIKSAATCKLAEDGCYDFAEVPCTGEDTCKEGKCVPPPSPCDTMPPGGICEGDVALKCTGKTLVSVDCMEQGMFCSINAQEQAECVLPCPVACQPGSARCDVDAAGLLVCSMGDDGCPREDAEPCPDGTTCQEGACLSDTPEGGDATTGDVGEDTLPDGDSAQPPADDGGFHSGYGKKESGCSTAPTGPGRASPATGGILLAAASLVCLFGVPRMLRKNRY